MNTALLEAFFSSDYLAEAAANLLFGEEIKLSEETNYS